MHDLHRCLNGTLSSENGNKLEWDNNFFYYLFLERPIHREIYKVQMIAVGLRYSLWHSITGRGCLGNRNCQLFCIQGLVWRDNWFLLVPVLSLLAAISLARFPHVDFRFMPYFQLFSGKKNTEAHHSTANQNAATKAKAATQITVLKISLESNDCSLRPSQTPYGSVINPHPQPLRIPFLPQIYLFILYLYLCIIHKNNKIFPLPPRTNFSTLGARPSLVDMHAL